MTIMKNHSCILRQLDAWIEKTKRIVDKRLVHYWRLSSPTIVIVAAITFWEESPTVASALAANSKRIKFTRMMIYYETIFHLLVRLRHHHHLVYKKVSCISKWMISHLDSWCMYVCMFPRLHLKQNVVGNSSLIWAH